MARASVLILDPLRPQPRKIAQAVAILRQGGVLAYPTDTVYGLCCDLHNRKAVERLYKIRGLSPKHRLSFVCADISSAAQYVNFSDFAHRCARRLIPGPYTMVLPATRAVPKVYARKRDEVGVRIPDCAVTLALVQELGSPVVSTSAICPVSGDPLGDPDDIQDRLGHQLEGIIDAGILAGLPSTVLRFSADAIEILRKGKGADIPLLR